MIPPQLTYRRALRDIPEIGIYRGEALRSDLVPRDPKHRKHFAVVDGTRNWSGEVMVDTVSEERRAMLGPQSGPPQKWEWYGEYVPHEVYQRMLGHAMSAPDHIGCIVPVTSAQVGHSSKTDFAKTRPGVSAADVAAFAGDRNEDTLVVCGTVADFRALGTSRLVRKGCAPDAAAAYCLAAYSETRVETPATLPTKAQLAFHRWAMRVPVGNALDAQPPVFFYTNTIGPWGGVACIFQLVSALRKRGINANVLCITEHRHKLNFDVTPYFLPGPGYLGAFLAQQQAARGKPGVVVATHWGSARTIQTAIDTAAKLSPREPRWQPVAFWQDREDKFADKGGNPTVRKADGEAYCAIQPRVMNAEWLKESGFDGLVIPVGLHPAFFATPPGPWNGGGELRVIGMYRPSTPRRGPTQLLEVFAKLKVRFGDRITTYSYGEPAPRGSVDHDLGALSSAQVAKRLDGMHLAFDTSEYQGFGLPALEAMARGAVPLTFDNHGIHTYGVHGRDVLICKDVDDMVAHAVKLLANSDGWYYAHQLAVAGVETAANYNWDSIAKRWDEEVLSCL